VGTHRIIRLPCLQLGRRTKSVRSTRNAWAGSMWTSIASTSTRGQISRKFVLVLSRPLPLSWIASEMVEWGFRKYGVSKSSGNGGGSPSYLIGQSFPSLLKFASIIPVFWWLSLLIGSSVRLSLLWNLWIQTTFWTAMSCSILHKAPEQVESPDVSTRGFDNVGVYDFPPNPVLPLLLNLEKSPASVSITDDCSGSAGG